MLDGGPNADDRFVDYYARQSESDKTRQRFEGTRRVALGLRSALGESTNNLQIVDIGCGAGTQTHLWAADGHRAHGIDISAPLIDLARERAAHMKLDATFEVCSANQLNIRDESVDVVLVSELLEHLVEWEPCVNEALRILRPGGVVYLSTTNRLCPIQQEFTLPAYSWYPASLKKHCERLAVTTRKHWVQYASFPAVHWFSFYQLRDHLNARGVTAKDRFDFIETGESSLRGALLAAIGASRPLRFFAHVLTPYTLVVGHRRRDTGAALQT